MSWFQKKKPQQFQQQKSELSANFAQDLMNLELEIESPNVTMETIQQLLELYATAVEHFSSIKDDKYLIFKNKSQSLLLRPNVSQALNSNYQSTSLQKEDSTNSLIIKKELENQLSQQDTYAVERFLHNERNNIERRKSMIDNELSAQDTRIAERMLKRVKDPTNLLKKSASLNSLKKLHLMAFDVTNVKAESACCLDKGELLKIQEEKHDDTPNKKKLLAESGIQKQFCKTENDNNCDEENQDHFFKQQKEEPSEQLMLIKKSLQSENDLVIKQPSTQYLVQSKEKKVREMVSSNKALSAQKSKLLQKNNILPF